MILTCNKTDMTRRTCLFTLVLAVIFGLSVYIFPAGESIFDAIHGERSISGHKSGNNMGFFRDCAAVAESPGTVLAASLSSNPLFRTGRRVSSSAYRQAACEFKITSDRLRFLCGFDFRHFPGVAFRRIYVISSDSGEEIPPQST